MAYGAGAALDGEVTLENGRITIGGGVGLVLGLSGKIGADVTIDVPQVLETGRDIADWIVPG